MHFADELESEGIKKPPLQVVFAMLKV